MANSKFSYVRSFECDDRLAPEQWIVVHLERKFPPDTPNAFLNSSVIRQKYTELMAAATSNVMDNFRDLRMSYIQFGSVELVFSKTTTVYKRRSSKLLSYLASCLASSFVRLWPQHYEEAMEHCPVFDGSVYLFPNGLLLRDYFTKCQVDHHLVNMRHTLHVAVLEQQTSRGLQQAGQTKLLSKLSALLQPNVPKGKLAGFYNEKLFTEFGINYNNEPELYKKGMLLLRKYVSVKASSETANAVVKDVSKVIHFTIDFKDNGFWSENFSLNEDITKKRLSFDLFQVKETVLPHSWIVVRIDGKAFHKLSEVHQFAKPNDILAINLMNVAATTVMKTMPNIVISFGESDEFSFVLDRYQGYKKYSHSLLSEIVCLFTSSYVREWPNVFGSDKPLQYSPVFDARVVVYPTNSSLRDYLSWRQADCHINNMYNTVFWKLVQLKGVTRNEAQTILNGTFSADKVKILQDLGIDYDAEPAVHRKGSVLYRLPEPSKQHQDLLCGMQKDLRDELCGKEACDDAVKTDASQIGTINRMNQTEESVVLDEISRPLPKSFCKVSGNKFNQEAKAADSQWKYSKLSPDGQTAQQCSRVCGAVDDTTEQCLSVFSDRESHAATPPSGLQVKSNDCGTDYSNSAELQTADKEIGTCLGIDRVSSSYGDSNCVTEKVIENNARRSTVDKKSAIEGGNKSFDYSRSEDYLQSLSKRLDDCNISINDSLNATKLTSVTDRSTTVILDKNDTEYQCNGSEAIYFGRSDRIRETSSNSTAEYSDSPGECSKVKPSNAVPDVNAGCASTINSGKSFNKSEACGRLPNDTALNICTDSSKGSHRRETLLPHIADKLSPSYCLEGANTSHKYTVMCANIVLCHDDIISDQFWELNTHILGREKSSLQLELE